MTLNAPDLRSSLELHRINLKNRKMTSFQENFMEMVRPSEAWAPGNSVPGQSLAFASD